MTAKEKSAAPNTRVAYLAIFLSQSMTAHSARSGCHCPDSQGVHRTFQVAGEFRRSLVYLVTGGAVVVAVAAVAGRQPIDPWHVATMAGLWIVLPLLAWLYAATWQLRVDEVGLWRRRLGSWTCWTWEELANGRVRLRKGILWRSDRSWLDRAIGLGFIGKEGAYAFDLVAAALPKEPTPEEAAQRLPAATDITIVTWFPFQRIRFHRQGLDVHRTWSCEMYRWEDVAQLRVFRYPHGDFLVHRIEVDLSGSGVDLSGGGKMRGDLTSVRVSDEWVARPHRKEATWAFSLHQIVPPAKWRLFEAVGELKSREEGEFRIQFWQKRQRWLWWLQWASFALLPLIAWKFFPGMWAMWNMPFLPLHWKIITTICGLLTMIMQPLTLYLLANHIRKQFRKHQRDAAARLREVATDSSRGTSTFAA